MTSTRSIAKRLTIAALAAIAALCFGCASHSQRGEIVLNGAGATFPALLYQQWFAEYAKATGVRINYQPIGSGGGIKNIAANTINFGASDAPMTDKELREAPGILHIPTVAGAVCIAYNTPDVPPNLKLTGTVIAKMYLGKITRWNDPQIAALNPGAALPATALTPFHRSDGSGTTNIFTRYLAAVSPAWKRQVGAGKSVKWPLGLGGNGNAGVAQLIQQNPGGIGYIELAYAVRNKIPIAAVRNASGNYITPSVKSTTAAVAGVAMPADFRIVPVNTSAPQGYPITGFTFLLVYPNADPQFKSFLNWAVTTGQKDAPSLYYAPLPANIRQKVLAEVSKIK